MASQYAQHRLLSPRLLMVRCDPEFPASASSQRTGLTICESKRIGACLLCETVRSPLTPSSPTQPRPELKQQYKATQKAQIAERQASESKRRFVCAYIELSGA